MKKLITKEQVIPLIQNGHTVMVGGFGLTGAPLTLIEMLGDSPVKELTVISNNLGEPGKGLGKLLVQKKIKKAIGSFFTSNIDAVKASQAGELEVELLPQGTMAEAIRAGGAGVGAIYIKASVDTLLSEEKEMRVIGDSKYVFQEALKADVAIIKAYKCDTLGNLIYRKSARNFNPPMATAAKVVIAEVEEIVEVGQLTPDEIVTPHLYVNYVVLHRKEGA
ncbi:succinyl-CoA--3-ketoacid-CoA transferase [Sporosarcina sp. P13]|uniref:CoA transferase subunit A n=1 Tax=Sporosarcina sp. P13 TaxID=2048263 RepID=UPI000C1711C1|nr:CoA transferase subunit A [Sporosarcina sp. P13]PIC65165.1 succinyl-CoA--3-ketoacid-CoA transferase [Sporosarcina sp. P13]